MPETFTKNPEAVLDYRIDWSHWLASDTISTSTWTVPDGITKDTDSKGDTTTTIWLSGGTLGQSYELVNHIVTAGGREARRRITVTVQEK